MEVLKRSGGITPYIVMLIAMCWNHWFGTIQDYERRDWSTRSQEDQQEYYYENTMTMLKYALIGMLVNNLIDVFIAIKAKQMGKGVHLSLFAKVMSAPINLFFDITPVGKVFQRFSEDLHVFNGEVFHCFRHIMSQITYLLFLFHLLVSISSWLLGFFLILSLLCYYVVRPYLAIDNQLHRIGHAVFSPMESYMD